ncbi:MAG: formylglycine-generating enzyme family protein [Puniceicoccaceae bacterium]
MSNEGVVRERRNLRDKPLNVSNVSQAGVSPGVLIFLMAVIAAVAAILIGIDATNRGPGEVAISGESEPKKDDGAAELFVALGEGGEVIDLSGGKVTGPLVERIGPADARPSGGPDSVALVAVRASAQVSEMLNLAKELGGEEDYPKEFLQGSALKEAADQALQIGSFDQATSLYERASQQLGKIAFEGVVASYRDEIEANGLSSLAETPTPRWLESEAQIKSARENIAQGNIEAGIGLIQLLRQKLPDLRQNTIDTWIASARAAAQNDQKLVAAGFYRRVLRLDNSIKEARDFLGTEVYTPGFVVENKIGMQFAFIPPNTFLQGSPELEAFRDEDEDQHEVTITEGFFIGVHEVTQREWVAVMGGNPELAGGNSFLEGDNLPITNVSWNEAVQFCERLGALDGKSYRLPTESEWELATRGGTTGPFSIGEGQITTQIANIYEFPPANKPGPVPVGTAGPANSFGLYDVHGNVWEWVADAYGPYPTSPVVDPQGPAAGPSATRVLRGGSYIDNAAVARSANRWDFPPQESNQFIGFRVLLELGSF